MGALITGLPRSRLSHLCVDERQANPSLKRYLQTDTEELSEKSKFQRMKYSRYVVAACHAALIHRHLMHLFLAETLRYVAAEATTDTKDDPELRDHRTSDRLDAREIESFGVANANEYRK